MMAPDSRQGHGSPLGRRLPGCRRTGDRAAREAGKREEDWKLLWRQLGNAGRILVSGVRR
jgi:hypothetical protein